VLPFEEVPVFESRVRPPGEVINVDLNIPGCPSRYDVTEEVIMALLTNKPVEIPNTNLCEVCLREKPSEGMAMDEIKRPFELGKPEEDVCMITQGRYAWDLRQCPFVEQNVQVSLYCRG